MEIWINTNNEQIMLPVTPTTVGVDRSINVATENVLKVGEVPIINGYNLKSIELSSFFTEKKYKFVRNFKYKPYDLATKFTDWMSRCQQFRLIVTETNINMPCIITDFSTREQDGSRDLYFDMKLLEYKEPKIPIVEEFNKPTENKTNRPIENNSTSNQKTHTVKKGDSLWSLAQTYYGKGSNYTKIQNANISKYPSLKNTPSYINDGWVLIIP